MTAIRTRLGISGLLSAAFILLLIIAAAWPTLLASADPNAISPADSLQSPSFAHPFGTDESGRDVLTRVIHGTAQSLGIGLAATGIGLLGGLLLGFGAGAGPRWVDALVSRFIEVLFALPTLVMALLLVAIYGAGVIPSIVAVGVAVIPGYARILREQTRLVVTSRYVTAARVNGQRPSWIFWRHTVPGSLRPLIPLAALGVGQTIIWVSALSFLGLGALPPTPEWGAMLNAGRVYLSNGWWLTFFPGLIIVLTAAAFTVLGRRFTRPGGAK